jgi:hypothetical protein
MATIPKHREKHGSQKMQAQQSAAVATIATHAPPRQVFTVGQFAKRNAAFSEAALRNLIFKADSRHSTKGDIPGNGLIEAGAIIRIGRKVLIDEARFFEWVESQQGTR